MKKQNGFIDLILVALVGLVVIGIAGTAFYLGKKSSIPTTINPIVTQQASPALSPADATANWKTYTNNVRNYTVKYPPSYSVKEQQKSQNYLEVVNLASADIVIDSDGQHSSVGKGGEISFIIFETGKDSYKNSILKDFGKEKIIESSINGKQAFIVNPSTIDTFIVIPFEYGFLQIDINAGYRDTTANQVKYMQELNQILSTFKFTQ